MFSLGWRHSLRHNIQRTCRHRLLATATAHSGAAATSESYVGSSNPAEHCANLVRTKDYESFLCSQLYPPELRNGFFALKAFSVELATVQDVVSNPMIGKMRMQFWRDTVKDISQGRCPKHPIGMLLYETSQQSHLSPYHLKRIVDARDAELDAPTYMTVEALTAHAESITSTMNYLLLSLISQNADSFSHAASHLGVAQTLTTLLRALPYHASKGRMVIPSEITAKHGVSHEEVFKMGGDAKGIDEAVFELATVANDHVITARSMFEGGKVPAGAVPVFAAAIPVISYLQRLEQANFDAFEGRLQVRDWKLPWKMWRAAYTKTF